MLGKRSLCAAALAFACCDIVSAAELQLRIADDDGNPAANAVVTIVPLGGAAMPPPAETIEARRLVDQRDETFIPLVTILPRGGSARFTNNDGFLHQVYSFSGIKQFELALSQGQTSDPVVFEESGVAAIGCNIHDQMIAYVFVTDSPWTVLTDEAGMAHLADIPEGTYSVEIWHPRLPPVTNPPRAQLAVAGDHAEFATRITLLPDRTQRHDHGGRY
jgi:plastocyanin